MEVPTKRQFTRIQFSREVRLIFQDARYDPCLLKDLSLTGMFVFGGFRQNVGDNCLVHLSQRGISTLLEINATAKVIWTSNEGLAIQFTTMTYDSYMYLQTTPLYETDDPLLIGFEIPENCPFEIIAMDQAAAWKENIFQNYSTTYL